MPQQRQPCYRRLRVDAVSLTSFIYIVKVQAGCGFIKDIERFTRTAFGEFPREFDTLRFTA